jgi:hypothetical protein
VDRTGGRSGAQLLWLSQVPDDGLGERLDRLGRDQRAQASPVEQDPGAAAFGVGRDGGNLQCHGLQQAESPGLGSRREAEQVRGDHLGIGVADEARKEDRVGDPEVGRQPLEGVALRSLAEDHQPGVVAPLTNRREGPQQQVVPLTCGQLRTRQQNRPILVDDHLGR